jgi:excinuclease ABC subunit A
MGQKWHFMRKGFPPGKPIRWEAEVLEELCEMLREVAPDAQFLWNNQIVVRVFAKDHRDPWASLITKKPEWLLLTLQSHKNAVPLGRFASLARERELDESKPDWDIVKLMFRTREDLYRGDLLEFLKEHLATRNDRD